MMAPDDPRHGTHAGYLAGCHCDDCTLGHYRANKERTLYRHRHGSCRVNHDRQAEVIEPWLAMGVTLHALCDAAGLGTRTDLAAYYERKAPINRGTFAAIAAVTEDDLPPTAFVASDLTRTRIYSLMAAGHKLSDMPILKTGHWRTRARLTVQQARDIRDHFQRLEMIPGTSRGTAARALNAGHRPPLAWDDPGTLAWPNGVPSRASDQADLTAVDEIAVLRATQGQRVRLTPAERREVVRILHARGLTDNQISDLTGMAQRTALRIRGELDLPAIDTGHGLTGHFRAQQKRRNDQEAA